MATIRYSTDSTSWTTATINLTPDAGGSTSWVSSQLSGSQINSIVTSNGIIGVITDNGLLMSSKSPSALLSVANDAGPIYSGTFDTLYKSVGTTWTTVTSTFGSTRILSAAYGNGLWVAGGAAGAMRTSTDATTWTTVTSNFTAANANGDIRSVAYANGLWVAVGYADGIRTSTNATTWTTATGISFVGLGFRSVAYGNGIWVGIGFVNSGQLVTSTNATTWTTANLSTGNTVMNAVAYGNGSWVAGGNTGQMRVSTNATTWTTVTSNFALVAINTVAYANGLWVAAGLAQMRISTDATTWTTVTSNMPGNIWSVNYGNGLWTVVGQTGNIRISTDTTTWTTVTSNFTDVFRSVAYGNGTWAAGGYTGNMRTSTNSVILEGAGKLSPLNNKFYGFLSTPIDTDFIYESTDLTSFSTKKIMWNTMTTSTIATISSLGYGNGSWVAVGASGGIRASTDTTTWTTVTSNFGASTIFSIAYGNGLWVAGGAGGAMRTSTDTTTWTTVTSNFGATPVSALAYANGTWVAGGQYGGTIRTSTDATTWTTRTSIGSGNDNVKSFSYGKSTWVARVNSITGYALSLRTSTDAITWSTSTISIPGNTIHDSLAYGNGLWVLIGSLSATGTTGWISTDGTTWSLNDIGSNRRYLIGYGNGLFVSTTNADPGVISSTNPSPATFNSMIKSETKTVMLANSGRIFPYNVSSERWDQVDTGINDNFINGSISTDGIYHIVGQNAVYRSSDSTTWTTITTLTASAINDIISK